MLVFTLGSFVPPDVPVQRVEIILPAIDPESPKNVELDTRVASRLLRWIGRGGEAARNPDQPLRPLEGSFRRHSRLPTHQAGGLWAATGAGGLVGA
jgi:hypothetical protein